jgi:hypothetical protein
MWAEVVLLFLGAPVTQNNVDNLTTWMTAENGSSTWTGTAGANNPLNNGLGSGGGSGLGSYTDLVVSAAYAAKGLEGGIQGAAPAGAALKANAPFSVFQTAIIKSGWAGSHYSGSGFAKLTAAAPPPVVSASSSASNGASKGVAVESAATQTQINGLNLLADPQSVLQSITNLPSEAGQAASSAASDAATATGLGGVEASLGTLLTDFTTAAFWQRLGIFVLGVAFVIGGVVLFVSTTKTGEKVESDALEAGAAVAVA